MFPRGQNEPCNQQDIYRARFEATTPESVLAWIYDDWLKAAFLVHL